MANHLESLIAQYHEWKRCIVRRNVKVGRRAKGGFAGELDVVVYDPSSNKVIHYEPSTDAKRWDQRADKYKRKFEMGQKFISTEVFPWLQPGFSLEQIAVFFCVPDRRAEFEGGRA